jgi:hypothetical protein
MSKKITLDLPEALFERAKRYADLQQQDVAEAIAALLDETLPAASAAANGSASHAGGLEDEAAMEREMHAYIAMHPELKKKCFGKYVAIYGEQLIDVDDDYGSLYTRIDKKYPNTFVWMTKVREEPIRTARVLSPRLDRVDRI